MIVRDHVDDPPASGGDHALADHLRDEPGAVEVVVDDGIPALRRELLRALRKLSAGIVDEDVDASQPVVGLLDHGLDLFNLADVALNGDRLAAGRARDFLASLLEILRPAARDRDTGSAF